ncbi:phage virion morphogenesis protein [Xanthomonas dyei]|uniref:phage virion morphogenesis protein n=1 Tax=Xanthomonas dyei TaxID=743699 RepID=UPI003CCD653F
MTNERGKLASDVGIAPRRSQSALNKQQAPDGSPYATRKQLLRKKLGCVKRTKMFAKPRHTKLFKVGASADTVSVGFVGRVSRIARMHP